MASSRLFANNTTPSAGVGEGARYPFPGRDLERELASPIRKVVKELTLHNKQQAITPLRTGSGHRQRR
jgi:hypothetical protein